MNRNQHCPSSYYYYDYYYYYYSYYFYYFYYIVHYGRVEAISSRISPPLQAICGIEIAAHME